MRFTWRVPPSSIRAMVQVLVAGLMLASGPAYAQISCPNGATGWDDAIEYPEAQCNQGIVWTPGVCNCVDYVGGPILRLFKVACTGGWYGVWEPPGCGGFCVAQPTEEKCPLSTPVEQTGTPPRKRKPCPEPPSDRGRPVSLTTGEMYFSHTDGVVGELSVTRSYNTARVAYASRYGAFGPGWNGTLDVRLNLFPPNIIEARPSDGTPLYYLDSNADGIYELDLPAGGESWIETIPGGYNRQLRAGGFETYDASGRIQSETDSASVVTTYTRDVQGRLSSVTRLGRTITIGYDGSSTQPTQIVGPGGAVLATYTYDAQHGWLEAVDYPDGSGYRYGYDASARIVWVRDADGKPVEAHDYDAQGRAITSEIADGQELLTFTYAANQTTVTDALGNATVYDWATIQHMYRVTKATGPCPSCGGGGGDSQEWTYDASGNITTYKDGAGKIWTYTYDSNDDLLTETDPLNRTTTYTYDAQGRVLTMTSPGGPVTTYTHGPAGPLTVTDAVSRTTTIAYNGQGKPSAITDPRGKTTTLAYNSTADLTSVTDPLSHATSFSYDAMGRRTTVTDALSHTTTTTYDARRRVTSIASPDGTHTDFTYDLGGRRASVRDPIGRTTYYTYDVYGRLTTVIDPMNGLTRYAYDSMSNLTSLTDAKGQTTTFTYDAFNRVSAVTYPGGGAETFTYDAAGRLATKTDRKAVVTTYTYDALGRLTGKSYSDGTPAVTFTYNSAGRMATAANGMDTLTLTYDLAGQLLSEQSEKNASTVAYTYDNGGNLLSVSLDGQVFVSYGYDDAGRRTSITRGSNVFGFGYDNANRRTSMTYPNGVVTSYTYDNLDHLTNLAAALGATAITSSGYTYDVLGNRTSKTMPDYSETYRYDPLSRLTDVTRGTSLTHYAYDAVGNRLSGQVDGSVTSGAFDAKNQLLSLSGGGTMRWRGSLNEPGNVTFTSATVNGKPARMLTGNVFEADLQMAAGTNTVTVQATDVSGNVTTKNYSVNVSGSGATYTYDANGNLSQKVEGPDTWIFEWTAENQLKRVTKNGAEVGRFSYDPLGRRVEKVAGGATTAYTYVAHNILREQTGSSVRRYVHDRGFDRPRAVEDGMNVLSYYHADGLESIVRTTNSTGSVTDSRQYDAFGNLQVGATQAGYAFTGREWDPETGFHYYRARYYDPKIGRFINEDPVRWRGGINFYEYAQDNPVRFVDPLGLMAAGVGGGAAGAAAMPQGGLMGDAGCMVVVDGHGNVGLLCCWGGGLAVGVAGTVSGQGMGALCLNCDTICDMPGFFGGAGGFGAAGGGMSASGGAATTSTTATVVGGLGPAGGGGWAVGAVAGNCELVLGGDQCRHPVCRSK